jgi:hypothetical protein
MNLYLTIKQTAITAGLAVWLLGMQPAWGDLADGLVSYWPLDTVQGNKTPDLVSGYDMELANLSAANLAPGKQGNAFSFSNGAQTLLQRVHNPGEDLPMNQHESYTLSMWVKVQGTGQNDLRVFSEGHTGNSNPLFNLGTHSGGADGTVDLFFRQTGWTTVDHIRSVQEPFDDEWSHIVFVQDNGERRLYIDGQLDELEIPAKPEGAWILDNTTIGGILRSSASHWVTGLIDEVAIWKRALSAAEVSEVNSNGLNSVFPPLAIGLVSHWPLDTVQGSKTPDLISGYDMDLNNLSADDLVDGKRGKAFSFANARQTLLSRVHNPGDMLPVNQHESFTISMWTKVQGVGQNDLRVFSEGNTGDSNPLFNIGTHLSGASGAVDLFFRHPGWTAVNHILTEQEPFDDEWSHVVFVQENGARRIYIDGQLDSLEIPDKPEGAWNVNNTTIGGILRSSASHWVTGLIDDVAIWSRALSAEEIQEVNVNGVPEVVSRQLPLEISMFKADFPAVVQGDTVVLRWDASKDAVLEITPGIGSVSEHTTFGAGQLEVQVEANTTYTLKATRGEDEVSSQVAVRTVSGVAPNWRLLDNFETYAAGPISGKGNWKNPEGVVSVVNLGLNKVLSYQGGQDLSALELNSLAVNEGEKATLFFRLFAPVDEQFSNIILHIGLTEKALRFIGDFASDVGPYIRLENFSGIMEIQARNGVGSSFSPEFPFLDFGAVYNFWLDIENKSIEEGDLYSLYVQKAGGARTLVFSGYQSDRNPQGSPELGQPLPELKSLLVAAIGDNQPMDNIWLDDFYLSRGGFESSVPVPASSFVKMDIPEEISISAFSYNQANNSFNLTWNSSPGMSYNILKKTNVTGVWTPLASGHPSGGAATSYTDANASEPAAFYQVTLSP